MLSTYKRIIPTASLTTFVVATIVVAAVGLANGTYASALLNEILQEEKALGQVSQGRCLAEESFEPLENSKHRLHLLSAQIGYQQEDRCQQFDALWLALYRRDGENYERLFGEKFDFTDSLTINYIPYKQGEVSLPIFYLRLVYPDSFLQKAYLVSDEQFTLIDESLALTWAESELQEGQRLDPKRARVRYSEDLIFYQSRVFNPDDEKRASGGEIYAELTLDINEGKPSVTPHLSSNREQARELETQGEQAMAEGKLEQAQEVFTDAIVAHSKEWDAWLGLAKAAVKSGNYEKAIAVSDDIIAADTSADNKAEALYIKGFAYELDGKILAAQSAYREALNLKAHEKAQMGLERLQ